MKSAVSARSTEFPPPPRSFRARGRELGMLASAVLDGHVTRIALVGAGGSGKSTLACALGHRVRPAFPGGIHWFRVGAWDTLTLTGMLALRFGVPMLRRRMLARLRAHLELEQTHLFAAMDQASVTGDVGAAVRVERLVARLEDSADTLGKDPREEP